MPPLRLAVTFAAAAVTGALRQRLTLPALATTLVLAPALGLGAIWALLLSDLFARWPRRTRGGDCWSW